MTDRRTKWYNSMLKKYKTDEAIREVMRQNASKSKRNKGGTGGFAKLTAEERKEVSLKGVQARSGRKI